MNMEKSNNTNHIKFTSNPVYSFYGLYRHCMQNPEMATNAIKGFENEKLMSLMEVIPEKGTNARIKSNSIQKEIVRQNISSYEGLKKLLSEYLPQEVDTLDKVLKPAFEAYSSFYDENKEAIDKNIETMNSTQAVYRNELTNLYKCFSISEDKQCCCYLNPFPKNKIIDGISNSENVSMDYSLNKNEDLNNYIENSNILKRKASTPFHETTHFLFFNSQFKKDIENESSLQMKTLLNSVIKSFEKNGNQDAKTSRDQKKIFAIGAINEAFAACSSALYNEKTTGQPVANKNEWYHGWKQANDLTRQMYPLFKEYIKTGKPFDDAFADRLSRAIKIDRLKNNETYLSKENKSSIAELRGLSTPTKVPYKAQIISKEKLQGLHYTYNSKLER